MVHQASLSKTGTGYAQCCSQHWTWEAHPSHRRQNVARVLRTWPVQQLLDFKFQHPHAVFQHPIMERCACGCYLRLTSPYLLRTRGCWSRFSFCTLVRGGSPRCEKGKLSGRLPLETTFSPPQDVFLWMLVGAVIENSGTMTQQAFEGFLILLATLTCWLDSINH